MQTNLYQLIISRLDGEKLSSLPYQEKVFELVRKGIAGFIVFGGEREEIKSFIHKLQAMADVPLFIASDIERGVGQQIKGCTEFPCQMAVRAAIQRAKGTIPDLRTERSGVVGEPATAGRGLSPLKLLHDMIRAIALEAIDVGINMPLIPVLDVNQRPNNPIICTRAFSDNPEDVSWFGLEYIRVLEDSGLISCAKHFPGHGDTSIDSHISLPVISKSYKDLKAVDIMPFQEAIKAGVASIMVGHLQIDAIDTMPASLSEKIIKGLLREELGFDGLVITDALNMSALSGIENLPAKCLKAGVDVLLHPADADAAVKELENAVNTKEVDEACIDRAIKRIRKVKSRLPHIRNDVGEGLVPSRLDYHSHKTLATRITETSITLVKQTAGLLPITDAHVVLAGADKFHEPSLWETHFSDVSTLNSPPPFTKGGQGELSGETILFAIFSEVSAWKGSSGIGDKERQKIIELIKLVPEGPPSKVSIGGLNRGRTKRSVIISFGSPYLLSHFKDANMLIAAYGATEGFQRAVIKGLKGEMAFKGKLPVKLNLA